ncbi:hypothetical protein EJ04DRAFT_440636 [Polyplosphaeria fusca]|uniref:Uncharacterized protein n=1 Tax=Polyplosphaeria fusca TaxID=682080 RepID=A0A9P4V0Y1_9PLEO|nr:hypothetical protein EJ04DRAFT_440636 [Polyplosphaeria fusca]
MVEFFSLLGFPARLAGRGLLAFRYVSNRGATAQVVSDYGDKRFGKSVRYRPWLMIDVKELEELEELINDGTDTQVESWRVSQLSVCGMIAIIGALVASAGVTALQLPGLEDCHFVARGTFVMSLLLSLLSVFFSGLQQSSFGRASEPNDIRKWLTSDTQWDPATMRTRRQSSMVAHMILQSPFEVVVMSITLYIVGMGTYLGSSWKHDLQLSTGSEGNRAVLLAFIIPTVFVLLMYGHMMGLKDREMVKTRDFDEKQIAVANTKLHVSSEDDLEAVQHVQINSTKTPGLTEVEDLRVALKEAAEAHRRAARADEEVANRYERLLMSR